MLTRKETCLGCKCRTAGFLQRDSSPVCPRLVSNLLVQSKLWKEKSNSTFLLGCLLTQMLAYTHCIYEVCMRVVAEPSHIHCIYEVCMRVIAEPSHIHCIYDVCMRVVAEPSHIHCIYDVCNASGCRTKPYTLYL